MKILQLNVWTGRIKGALLDFFATNNFDVICLQEAAWMKNDDSLRNMFTTVGEIEEAAGLKNVFMSSNWGIKIFSDVMEQGNAILSRNKIINQKTKLIYGKYKLIEKKNDFYDHAYTLQIVKLEGGVNIVNYHGYWQPNPIGNQTTIETMRQVAEYLKCLEGPIIMCGDFNISHDSPAMKELSFMRDLTENYKLHNTLTGLKFNGEVACDHILVTPDIKVKNFETLDDLISDHKALVLETEG